MQFFFIAENRAFFLRCISKNSPSDKTPTSATCLSDIRTRAKPKKCADYLYERRVNGSVAVSRD